MKTQPDQNENETLVWQLVKDAKRRLEGGEVLTTQERAKLAQHLRAAAKLLDLDVGAPEGVS
jgi:hypothetical protein